MTIEELRKAVKEHTHVYREIGEYQSPIDPRSDAKITEIRSRVMRNLSRMDSAAESYFGIMLRSDKYTNPNALRYWGMLDRMSKELVVDITKMKMYMK